MTDEIVFKIELCEHSGFLVASWDAPSDHGGITTQGKDLRELQEQLDDAVRCHFEPNSIPSKICLQPISLGSSQMSQKE